MPAPFRTHEDPDLSDAHSNINALSCRLRTLFDTAAAARDGETCISEVLTQTAVNRLVGEFYDLIGHATDIVSGTTGRAGTPETFVAALRVKLSENRQHAKFAASHRTALDAGVVSSVGA